jgi:hypothetical protein
LIELHQVGDWFLDHLLVSMTDMWWNVNSRIMFRYKSIRLTL